MAAPIRACAACGCNFSKPARYSWRQWQERICCSRGCWASIKSLPRPIETMGLCAFVPLTNGKRALVDSISVSALGAFNWHVTSGGYAAKSCSRSRGARKVYMHRFLMPSAGEHHIDHVNGDKLDNRLANLRVATCSENLMNAGPRLHSSKFKGVHMGPFGWVAQVRVNGKTRHLGLFDTEESAATARDFAAMESYGRFARLNFPELAK